MVRSSGETPLQAARRVPRTCGPRSCRGRARRTCGSRGRGDAAANWRCARRWRALMLPMAFIPGVATANWRPEPGFALAGQSTGTEVTCKEESLMKATIALLGAALALSACTRVIERPVPTATGPAVVTTPALSERVVERPSAA